MRQLLTIGIVGLVAVGIVGINFVSVNNLGVAETQTQPMTTGKFLGHVEVVAADKNGNIIAYRQSDNTVTNVGHNCIAKAVWPTGDYSTGHQPCSGTPAEAKYIALTNTAITPTATDTTLSGEITTNGLARAAGTPSAFQVASDGTTSTIAQVQKVFAATASQSAQAAGLFDAASGGNMFADNTFATVSLNNGDTLTVTWKITLS